MAILRPFRQPYASVRVAVYEAMLLDWISLPGVTTLVNALANRYAPRRGGVGRSVPTIGRFDWRPPVAPVAHDVDETRARRPARSPAPTIRPAARHREIPKDEVERRRRLLGAVLADEQLSAAELERSLSDGEIPHLLGVSGLQHALSPIGIAHVFRQLYFDGGSGVGPIEHAFSLAPKEELQILQQMSRRESVERTETYGTEVTLEKSAEQSTIEEVSDHVATSIQRDMQVGISASTEGTIGIWSGAASGSFDLAGSTQRSREVATTRTAARTQRSAETLRKSYSISVKSHTELTESNSVRRTVRNDLEHPVSYGLRRVLRSVRVKLQALGPRLCWQLYVRHPGAGLAQSKLVMFREAEPVLPSDVPNAPPRPQGGAENGTATVRVERSGPYRVIRLTLPKDAAKEYTAVAIDTVSDADPQEKDAEAPGMLSTVLPAEETEHAITYAFAISAGTASVVTVGYTRHFEPSEAALGDWLAKVEAARQSWEAEQAEAAFERGKRVIFAKGQVRPRPAADLREEERYELLNRMIETAFQRSPSGSLPEPVEIEIFHRLFEISSMFYFVHPAWWKPRYGVARSDYEITDDSEPARFGKSLGWLIQLDGDRRRNELLNSPWVRTCVPIRPGREREALSWLAEHIEGRRGFSLGEGSALARLLADIEGRRVVEREALPGPDYVTLEGEVAPGRELAADAYPVIEEFDIVLATDGFVYEALEVSTT